MSLKLELQDVITNEVLTEAQVLLLKGDKGDKGDPGKDGSDAEVNATNVNPFIQQYVDAHIDNYTLKKDSSGKYFASIDESRISESVGNYLNGTVTEGYEDIATAQEIGSYNLPNGINGTVEPHYFSTDARFNEVIYLNETTTVSLSNLDKYKFAAYKVVSGSDMTRAGYMGFYSAEVTINEGYYLFFVKKIDESDMTSEDLPQIVLQKKVINSGVTLKLNVPDESITEQKLSESVRSKLNSVSSSSSSYVLPDASTTTLGGIKIDGNTIVKNSDGTYSAKVTSTTTVDEYQLANAVSAYMAEHQSTAELTELKNRVDELYEAYSNDNPLGQVTSVVEEDGDDQIFFIELTGNTVVPSFTVETDGDDQVFYIEL